MDLLNNRLIILSGPSCVGKSPLSKALARFYPELYKNLSSLVLYNSRSARPGETDGKDYYFRSRSEIEILKEKDDFVVMNVRGDLQALNLKELRENLTKGDVFFEGNPSVGRMLQTHEALRSINRISIFMSPISKEEVQFLKNAKPAVSLPLFTTDIMRRKLLRRTRKQKGELSIKDLENIETRASSAWNELLEAHHFQYVIPNHDGEDSDNWDAFYYPLGDAYKSLMALVSILEERKHPHVEKWEQNLLNEN
jgi:guanylate kinase